MRIAIAFFILLMPAVHSSAHDHPHSEEVPDFVWSFMLETDRSADAWRIELTPEIMQRLNRPTADDLMIFDAQNRMVPFARVPDSMLTESVTLRWSLIFQGDIIAADQPEKPDLSLEFEHGGARLRVNAPETESRIDSSDALRYEALIALPAASESINDAQSDTGQSDRDRARLQIEFETEQRISMTCWLRSADRDAPATLSTGLSIQQASRPLRYRGEFEVPVNETAWHLACYGPDAPPDDLQLIGTEWMRQVQHDHQPRIALNPVIEALAESPETLQFELLAPYRALHMSLTSDRPGVFSRLHIRSRDDAEEAWRQRGEMTLSTLENSPNQAFALEQHSYRRDRSWQIEAEPPLDHLPELELEVVQDTLVFLAQGEPPWQLRVGSREAGIRQLAPSSLNELSQSIGPIWQWPEIRVSAPERIGDDSLLEPPTEPIEWSRYLLWLVLVVGSLLVIVMAVRLLRSPPDRR